ncbi:hypothetical protein ABK040_000906 [Willaertia magna]
MKIRLLISVLLINLMIVTLVKCHSWIDCTDYTEKNGKYYDAAKCRARPRNWSQHTGGGVFGADTGYNHQDLSCKYALSGGNYQSFYTSAYPMATYKPGQEVCLAWPAKNHVAATCTNQYIPDTSNKIYYSSINPTSDPSTNDWKLLVDWGNNPSPSLLGQGGGKAFQNCPAFCENMDKALCTGCFTIPSTWPEGRYAFQWRWIFNAGSAPYTSCWDAQVTKTGTPVTPTPVPSTGNNNGGGGGNNNNPPVNNNTPLVGNSIRITSPPSRVGLNPKTIDVKVEYSATQTVDIVVDLLSLPNYVWFGKAIQKNVNSGSGTLNLSIQVQNNPQAGNYVIKPWIVAAGQGEANLGWTQELDRKEYPMTMSENAVVIGSNNAVRMSLDNNSGNVMVMLFVLLHVVIYLLLL